MNPMLIFNPYFVRNYKITNYDNSYFSFIRLISGPIFLNKFGIMHFFLLIGRVHGGWWRDGDLVERSCQQLDHRPRLSSSVDLALCLLGLSRLLLHVQFRRPMHLSLSAAEPVLTCLLNLQIKIKIFNFNFFKIFFFS